MLSNSFSRLSKSRDLVEAVENQAALRGDDVAFTVLEFGETPAGSLTFRDIDRQARQLAGYLQDSGGPGERATILLPNGLEFIIAFWGCIYSGNVAVPTTLPRNARGVEHALNVVRDAGARWVITTSANKRRFQKLHGSEHESTGWHWVCIDDLKPDWVHAWRRPETGRPSTALLQYTSGSTGDPKGAVCTHDNLIHNCIALDSAFNFPEGFRLVSWLPCFHDWGLIGCTIFPLLAGMPTWLFDSTAFLYEPMRWLRAIMRFNANISCAPNFAYDTCVRVVTPDDLETLRLESWEVAMVGAEPVRATTLERFATVFAKCGFRKSAFYPSYGLAENTLIVSGGSRTSPPTILSFDRSRLEYGRLAQTVRSGAEFPKRTLVSCGRPLPGQTVNIRDSETGALCDEGVVGEVYVSGLCVVNGYWRRPVEADETFVLEDGNLTLRTGDQGFMLEGELFICGRLKNLIIKDGKNVSAEDIERSAEGSHSALRPGCGAAFSVEIDDVERLVVIYELNYGQKPDTQEVIAAIRRSVLERDHVMTDAIVLIEPGSLQKTTSGKIRRQSMQSSFLNQGLRAVASWDNWRAPSPQST